MQQEGPRASRRGIYIAAIVMLIMFYVWTLSATGVQAATPLPAPLSPLSAELAGIESGFALQSLGYFSAFFVGGIAITLLQQKNKSHINNDITELIESYK